VCNTGLLKADITPRPNIRGVGQVQTRRAPEFKRDQLAPVYEPTLHDGAADLLRLGYSAPIRYPTPSIHPHPDIAVQ
jgi:hypothetical protein